MNQKTPRTRLDKLLVDRELVKSRERAKALIMAGAVIVNDHRIDKPGTTVPDDATIRLKVKDIPYVSRGGLKLEQALRSFAIDPTSHTCLDIGSSTGGFTDCLLQHGASHVHAVDVGTNQLDWKLRTHPQVTISEQTDIRDYQPPIGTRFDLIVTDVSFISLTKIIEPITRLASPGTRFIGLVKPQFELSREKIARGGIVKEETHRLEALEKVLHALRENGHWEIQHHEPSQTPGTDGNIEYLLLARKISPENR
ncbi:TlyA family RNA methyltransferase [Desulfurispirillum indicum]|uniref:Hemolysin A n=1 Tax=Desulfurispirillum indicum (strain ATCC BAA-1389 / DSM 22839 / S5) TaxID=653733 RepID=E6W2S7_DESIS|nr:TlyA family RNA methyltransferase [Desulfurispirillum indicum]ADU65661.1 hemolysin A [Desulfurispirillum indicum S5]UCZ57505.1 TlyA family RNA methyltransferase [Desulfurispirillum indicum]